MKKTFILIIVILILGLVGEGIKLADKNLKLELIGDSEVQVEVNSEYNDSGAEARFFNKDMTSKIKRTGKVDTSKLGEYEIKYEFQDREVIRKVIVKDTQKPEITLKGIQFHMIRNIKKMDVLQQIIMMEILRKMLKYQEKR